MDSQVREQIQASVEHPELRENKKPFKRAYDSTIKRIMRIVKIEAPLCKLEHFYQCCVKSVEKELDQFWKYRSIKKKALTIDTDALQGILIYVLLQTDYANMVAEVEMSELFLPESVALSSRNFYLVMIKSSIEFIRFDGERLLTQFNDLEGQCKERSGALD